MTLHLGAPYLGRRYSPGRIGIAETHACEDTLKLDRLPRRAAAAMASALLALAACAAPAANPTAAPASGGVPTTAPATTNPTSGTTSATATSAPGGGKPIVDLTFTGDLQLEAKGPGGACSIGKDASGAPIGIAFLASEADFPGLGTSFNVTEDIASHKVSVKWVVGDAFIAGVIGSGVTVAPDHSSVAFDSDLPAGLGRTEHLKGSITCP
jgi:hypothetical protein